MIILMQDFPLTQYFIRCDQTNKLLRKRTANIFSKKWGRLAVNNKMGKGNLSSWYKELAATFFFVLNIAVLVKLLVIRCPDVHFLMMFIENVPTLLIIF